MVCKELVLGIILASTHVSGDYHESNTGLSLECDQYIAGVYENSYQETTSYVGLQYSHNINRYVSVGAKAALATGYDFTPIVGGLTVSAGSDNLRMEVLTVGFVTAVQAKWRF